MPTHIPINILLVEDDEIDVQNVQRAFKKNKLSNPLHIAGNGLEALKMIKGNGIKSELLPCIVLLDLNMPKMNGIEFLKEVREDPGLKSLQIFVLTTSNNEMDKVKAFDFNVAGYILKPVEFHDFVEAVKTLNAFWTLCEHLT